jgi:WD40 repeat protein
LIAAGSDTGAVCVWDVGSGRQVAVMRGHTDAVRNDYIYIYVCVYVYIHMYICIYINIYINIYPIRTVSSSADSAVLLYIYIFKYLCTYMELNT